MSHHDILATETCLFIAHNEADVVHWGEVNAGQQISTGQPNLETFPEDQRSSWESRLEELGISSEDIYPEDPSLKSPSGSI